nr:imidazole glycerol phosphate synthase subunit HisH [Actinomycetota bacterium]
RRVPHMGWNALAVRRASVLLEGLDGADVYFAHSYAAEPENGVAVADVEHDGTVVAAVEHGPVAGVQFHPERSGPAGALVLENALRWSRSA